jgi:adenylate cyclase
VSPDDALAETLRKGRVVLGYAMTFDGAHQASRFVRAASSRPGHRPPLVRPERRPVLSPTGAVCNLESLSGAAGVSGFLNAAPDPDGILRRVPMLVEFDGGSFRRCRWPLFLRSPARSRWPSASAT